MNPMTRFDPLDDLFRGFFVRPMALGQDASDEIPTCRIDVREDDSGYVVHADLPGVKKEDIHVTIDGNQVSISAETTRKNDVKEGDRVLRSERYVGKLSRSFQLASEIDESAARASYSDGVLELTLPRKQTTVARRLSID